MYKQEREYVWLGVVMFLLLAFIVNALGYIQ